MTKKISFIGKIPKQRSVSFWANKIITKPVKVNFRRIKQNPNTEDVGISKEILYIMIKDRDKEINRLNKLLTKFKRKRE
jgi:uncharacterized pyridoxamine 5'-phosphate oxidase family protein